MGFNSGFKELISQAEARVSVAVPSVGHVCTTTLSAVILLSTVSGNNYIIKNFLPEAVSVIIAADFSFGSHFSPLT